MTARCRATLRGPAQSAGTCRIATGAPENSLAQDDSATPILSPCCLHQRVRHLIYVMTLWRTKMGISKAEDDDGQLSHASWLGSSRTAARWLAEGITKAELQAAATGTGVKGSANHSRPTLTLNLLVLAPDTLGDVSEVP